MNREEAKVLIAKRIAREFESAERTTVINTGVGIPTMVPDFIKNENIVVHAENGILGVGPIAKEGEIDDQLINAGRQPVLTIEGCSFFDSAFSFGIIRGGHVDATILGAFEVDEKGNVANWIIPNGRQLGVGGAMDLVSGAKKVIIAMIHTDKKNNSKVKRKCTLPITGYGVVDMLVTDKAVFVFENGKMILKEIAPGLSLEDLRRITEAEFEVSNPLGVME
jgi:3-oxoacid CoA-transferase B subunit